MLFIESTSHHHRGLAILKDRDTFGNCQRPVFSLGVSPHNICINNEKAKLRDNNERKNTIVTRRLLLNR